MAYLFGAANAHNIAAGSGVTKAPTYSLAVRFSVAAASAPNE